MSIEDELKKEIALLTRENQQLTHQLFDYRAAFIRSRDRKWVGLTDEEREQVRSSAGYNQFMSAGEYAEAVQWATEAKLKEKNT